MDINSFADAIANPVVWRYAEMICHLFGVVEHAMHWCEGCSCHRSFDADGAVDGERLDPDPLRQKSCPLAGRRTPEMAIGDSQRKAIR